jgi:hypothetical protein
VEGVSGESEWREIVKRRMKKKKRRRRERQREKEREREKDKDKDRDTETDRQTDRQTDKERERQRERERERQRERERERETETNTDRDRETDRDRQNLIQRALQQSVISLCLLYRVERRRAGEGVCDLVLRGFVDCNVSGSSRLHGDVDDPLEARRVACLDGSSSSSSSASSSNAATGRGLHGRMAKVSGRNVETDDRVYR